LEVEQAATLPHIELVEQAVLSPPFVVVVQVEQSPPAAEVVVELGTSREAEQAEPPQLVSGEEAAAAEDVGYMAG
jgi:hypothetical protein